jgi:hypothetical protein
MMIDKATHKAIRNINTHIEVEALLSILPPTYAYGGVRGRGAWPSVYDDYYINNSTVQNARDPF